jgi:hypothetical protein
MESTTEFIFDPLPPIEEPAASAAVGEPVTFAASAAHPLGPLTGLAGTWTGRGFNVIWRPHQVVPVGTGPSENHFLELNLTEEQLDFGPALGKIPNRGLLQRDIPLHGLSYLQRISDANLSHGSHDSKQHFEPGLWVLVPKTDDPDEPHTVARMASIPHGTTFLAQGTADTSDGGPSFPKVSITPFKSGLHHPPRPADLVPFPQEQDLSTPSTLRTSGDGLHGITQRMVNDPHSFFTHPPPPITPTRPIAKTTKLHVSTHGSLPGGGAANIAFLNGGHDGPNAVTTRVTATFWLQTFQGDTKPTQLQYSQTVLLDFDTLSWPHVTVATLHKQGPTS